MKKPELNTQKNQNVVRSNHGDNKITNLNLTINDVTPLVLRIEEQEAIIAKQELFIDFLVLNFKKIWMRKL